MTMADISIERRSVEKFLVTVADEAGITTHGVTVTPADLEKYAGEHGDAEELLEKSFEFLLEHEPHQFIHEHFDLSEIERFFPEYTMEIRRRLGLD